MIFCSFERCGEGVDLLSCFEFRVEPSIKKKFRVEPCHSVALYSVSVYLLPQVFSHWISDFKKNRTMLFCNSAPLPEKLQTFICNYVKAFFFFGIIYQPSPMSFSSNSTSCCENWVDCVVVCSRPIRSVLFIYKISIISQKFFG